MRVGIIALLHESNTFISQPTTLEHFRQGLLCTAEQVRERMADTHHEVGGFFDGLVQQAYEAVPIFAARATPFGAITSEAFDTLLAMLFEQLDAAGPLDGLLVAPHGATVCESHPDADGYWLTELRKRVGERLPIVGTLDAHANLSPDMVAACNALVAYRSNPHLDQRARGIEAARLLGGMLRGELAPTMEAAFPPLAINIERQLTSEPHLKPLYALADEMLTRAGVLSNSVLLGFPYADVAEMGSAAVVVTNNDQPLAQQCVAELEQYLLTHREEFDAQLISIDEALAQAASRTGPTCLLDMGDNVGGGSPADSTFLAHALHERGLRSFVCLYDPDGVEAAVRAGPGARIDLSVGGKTDDDHGAPLTANFEVLGLYDGKFHEPEPRHGGFTHCDQGRTAVVRTAELTVMLTSRRMPPFSLQQLISCELDPTSFSVLVAKGVNAPVAAYAPVCAQLIRVNTPGCTTADMCSLPFHHRRRPLFPFER